MFTPAKARKQAYSATGIVRGILFGVLFLSLAACDAVKPTEIKEVAVQGLLSGAVSPDARFAVFGSIQHGGGAWDLQSANRVYNWNHKAGEMTTLRAVAISGDGRRAITVKDRELAVWDATNGKSLFFWQASDKVLSIALNGDGRLAVLGMQNNQAVLFDVDRGAERQVFQHEAEVYGVAIDDSGARVMTGSDDFSAVLWDASKGQPLHRIAHDNQVKQVAISSDGSLFFSAAQRELGRVRDAVSAEVKVDIPLEYENFTAVRFSADNKQLLLGTFRGDLYLYDLAQSKRLVHWRAQSREPLASRSRSGSILSVAFSGRGALALVSDGTYQIFQQP